MTMHERMDPAFDALIDVDAAVRKVVGGCTFTEGPIWHPVERHLLFSDMPADVRRRWAPGQDAVEVMRPSHKGNGMTYDSDLNLVVCEHTTSSLVRFSSSGERTVLASHYEGQELNSPNDVCLRSCGSIYFTDPWFGRMPHFGVERPRALGWQGVFRVRPGADAMTGEPDLLVDRYRFGQPNGLCFSPDETLMYINDTEQANIRVFDVDKAGLLKHGRLFASGIRDPHLAGVPDGMKCDHKGNVWVTAPGGLWVFAPDGRLLGKVSIPELAANLHWGGDDWRTLYICATTSVYAVATRVTPRSEPFMTVVPLAERTVGRATSTHVGSRSTTDSAPRSTTDTNGIDESATSTLVESLTLDASRCALIIQDMQNDVVMDGGAFADSGSPEHCRAQGNIPRLRQLAAFCRERGIPVIHVWFVCEPGHPEIGLNAPLFEGLVDANALVKGTWGVEPVAGLEPQPGDHMVTKQRMSAWENTELESTLKAEGRDCLISAGAWTNLSIEHTARTGADKGYLMIVPEDGCSTMNAAWHRASIDFALTNVAAVTRVDAIMKGLE